MRATMTPKTRASAKRTRSSSGTKKTSGDKKKNPRSPRKKQATPVVASPSSSSSSSAGVGNDTTDKSRFIGYLNESYEVHEITIDIEDDGTQALESLTLALEEKVLFSSSPFPYVYIDYVKTGSIVEQAGVLVRDILCGPPTGTTSWPLKIDKGATEYIKVNFWTMHDLSTFIAATVGPSFTFSVVRKRQRTTAAAIAASIAAEQRSRTTTPTKVSSTKEHAKTTTNLSSTDTNSPRSRRMEEHPIEQRKLSKDDDSRKRSSSSSKTSPNKKPSVESSPTAPESSNSPKSTQSLQPLSPVATIANQTGVRSGNVKQAASSVNQSDAAKRAVAENSPKNAAKKVAPRVNTPKTSLGKRAAESAKRDFSQVDNNSNNDKSTKRSKSTYSPKKSSVTSGTTTVATSTNNFDKIVTPETDIPTPKTSNQSTKSIPLVGQNDIKLPSITCLSEKEPAAPSIAPSHATANVSKQQTASKADVKSAVFLMPKPENDTKVNSANAKPVSTVDPALEIAGTKPAPKEPNEKLADSPRTTAPSVPATLRSSDYDLIQLSIDMSDGKDELGMRLGSGSKRLHATPVPLPHIFVENIKKGSKAERGGVLLDDVICGPPTGSTWPQMWDLKYFKALRDANSGKTLVFHVVRKKQVTQQKQSQQPAAATNQLTSAPNQKTTASLQKSPAKVTNEGIARSGDRTLESPRNDVSGVTNKSSSENIGASPDSNEAKTKDSPTATFISKSTQQINKATLPEKATQTRPLEGSKPLLKSLPATTPNRTNVVEGSDKEKITTQSMHHNKDSIPSKVANPFSQSSEVPQPPLVNLGPEPSKNKPNVSSQIASRGHQPALENPGKVNGTMLSGQINPSATKEIQPVPVCPKKGAAETESMAANKESQHASVDPQKIAAKKQPDFSNQESTKGEAPIKVIQSATPSLGNAKLSNNNNATTQNQISTKATQSAMTSTKVTQSATPSLGNAKLSSKQAPAQNQISTQTSTKATQSSMTATKTTQSAVPSRGTAKAANDHETAEIQRNTQTTPKGAQSTTTSTKVSQSATPSLGNAKAANDHGTAQNQASTETFTKENQSATKTLKETQSVTPGLEKARATNDRGTVQNQINTQTSTKDNQSATTSIKETQSVTPSLKNAIAINDSQLIDLPGIETEQSQPKVSASSDSSRPQTLVATTENSSVKYGNSTAKNQKFTKKSPPVPVNPENEASKDTESVCTPTNIHAPQTPPRQPENSSDVDNVNTANLNMQVPQNFSVNPESPVATAKPKTCNVKDSENGVDETCSVSNNNNYHQQITKLANGNNQQQPPPPTKATAADGPKLGVSVDSTSEAQTFPANSPLYTGLSAWLDDNPTTTAGDGTMKRLIQTTIRAFEQQLLQETAREECKKDDELATLKHRIRYLESKYLSLLDEHETYKANHSDRLEALQWKHNSLLEENEDLKSSNSNLELDLELAENRYKESIKTKKDMEELYSKVQEVLRSQSQTLLEQKELLTKENQSLLNEKERMSKEMNSLSNKQELADEKTKELTNYVTKLTGELIGEKRKVENLQSKQAILAREKEKLLEEKDQKIAELEKALQAVSNENATLREYKAKVKADLNRYQNLFE